MCMHMHGIGMCVVCIYVPMCVGMCVQVNVSEGIFPNVSHI